MRGFVSRWCIRRTRVQIAHAHYETPILHDINQKALAAKSSLWKALNFVSGYFQFPF